MTPLSLPFFNFNVGSIRTAYYPGSSLFLDGHLSQCSKRFRAVSEQRTRNKNAEFRLWRPERVLESVHREKEGRSSFFLFFLVDFSPDLLGSWLCIILDPTAAPSEK